MRDFLAYLKVFLNPDDDVSLLRIANVPARGLSEATMERLLSASQEHQCPVFGAMTNPVVQAAFPAKTRESIAAFVEFIQRCRAQLADETLARDPQALQKWAMQFVAETGYVEELRRSEKEVEAAEGRVRNLQDLAGSMDEGERGSLPPLERLQFFLEELTLDRDREAEEETSGEAVTLITMHSCKGLEFPHVYIVGLEDGLLPHARSEEERTLDEERRLFYVAITRAQESLTLSYCRGRKKFGETTPCHPSRFLKELPPELIEHADEKARQPVAVDAGRNLFAAMRSAAE